MTAPAMDLSIDEDRRDLAQTLRALLRTHSDEAAVRAHAATELGWDREVWATLAGQVGVAGLAVPEGHGGAGCGFRELAVVLEEAGRALLCAPLLSSAVLATAALLVSGDEQACADQLPAMAAGERTAAVAMTGVSGRVDPAAVDVSARLSGDAWLLDGQACFVVDGASADLLVVAATTPGGLSLFLVDDDAAGLTRTPLRGLDLTRRTARLELDGTPARLLGTQGDGWRVLQVVRDHGAAALAAEQVGVARACLEMAVDYAKVRVQFGRPIGSFQAIKHRCADVLMQVEAATSAAAFAGWVADEDPDCLPEAAALAGFVCAEAGVFAAEENVQVHGGIGFTWEHPAHLFVRRAHSNAVLLGTADEARDRLVDHVLKLP